MSWIYLQLEYRNFTDNSFKAILQVLYNVGFFDGVEKNMNFLKIF